MLNWNKGTDGVAFEDGERILVATPTPDGWEIEACSVHEGGEIYRTCDYSGHDGPWLPDVAYWVRERDVVATLPCNTGAESSNLFLKKLATHTLLGGL